MDKKHFIDTLKNNDLKVTQARIAILTYLHKVKTPVDVQEIMDYIKKENVLADQATVYRILNIFVERNLVKQIEFKEGKIRYELASLPHHHHVVCTNCGAIEDIENCELEDIEQTLQKKTNYKIQSHNLEFFGLCPQCN